MGTLIQIGTPELKGFSNKRDNIIKHCLSGYSHKSSPGNPLCSPQLRKNLWLVTILNAVYLCDLEVLDGLCSLFLLLDRLSRLELLLLLLFCSTCGAVQYPCWNVGAGVPVVYLQHFQLYCNIHKYYYRLCRLLSSYLKNYFCVKSIYQRNLYV